MAFGAALAAPILIVIRVVSESLVSEKGYVRVGIAAWGVGTAVVSALQGHWVFALVALVVGLLFLVSYSVSGDGSSSSYDSSSTSYESSSSSPESSSSSSDSDFSGGGGDGGGGGSSDSW